MSKPKTVLSSLEPQDQLKVAIVEEFFGKNSSSNQVWRWYPDEPVPSIANRFQVRDGDLVAKPSDVDKFSRAYQDGNPVPAIVTTMDGSKGSPRKVVDGSTRSEGMIQAAKAMKVAATIPTIMIMVDPDNMDLSTERNLYLLGTALNGDNGTPMTLRNISRVLTFALPDEDTLSAASLAKLLRVSDSTVQRARALRRAEARAAELDITLSDEDRALSESAVALLGQKDAKISDEIFRAVVSLTLRARLSTPEMKQLFREIESSGDDAVRKSTIKRWESENADRIEGRAARPTGGRRLMLLLGQVVKISAESTVPRDASLVDANLRRLDEVQDKLDEIRKLHLAKARTHGPAVPTPFRR